MISEFLYAKIHRATVTEANLDYVGSITIDKALLKEVGIKKLGDIVLLFPKENTWDIFTSGLKSFSDDFMEDGRNQESAENRENL